VSVDDVAAHHLAGADAAVVRALGRREAVPGPAVWPAVRAEKSVLLLEAEPEFVLLVSIHDEVGVVSEVVRVRSAIRHPRLAHHENVGFMAERTREVGDWAEVDVGVVTGRLAGGGTVEVPFWQLVKVLDWFCDGLQKIEILAIAPLSTFAGDQT
jgi:hypothetical protein